ncbi:MAG: hypothetical protein NWR72_16905 [Bacteroidia bacterium]|nr:hypothetical protein [Bacteroidia bacterium]
MASGKMSPRQKMINMMYLVLLALLAMNVSAEILNAFENIKLKLNGSATEASNNANGFMEAMKAEIREEIANQGKRDNEGLLTDTLDNIKGETSEIIALLDKHIQVLGDSIAKRDPETGALLAKDETEKNLQYWMGQGDAQEANDGRGSAKAFELHQRLDEYVNYVVNMYNSQIKSQKDSTGGTSAGQKITFEDEKLTNDPSSTLLQDGGSKTWERYTFEGPVIANMATLEAIKLDVYEKQKLLLNILNERLGVATFKADKVVGLVAPEATIVPAGLQFKAKLFAVLSSESITPSFSSASGTIKPDEDNKSVGVLTVNASGGVIPNGKNEGTQQYKATIRVPKATGGFEDLSIEGSFTVRKPEIVVTSAAIQILYANCANDVNIDVPALGDAYNPVITATNAEIITNQQSKIKFRIVPTARTCVVTVNSNTNGQKIKIGDLTYKVIQPPKPTIDIRINGQKSTGAAVPKTSNVQVILNPDEDFKSALPQDAGYAISSIDVLAQLSLGPPQTVNSINASGQDATRPIAVSLGTQVRQARPGTTVYIRINDIYRVNFQKKRIPDTRFTEIEKIISIVVK